MKRYDLCVDSSPIEKVSAYEKKRWQLIVAGSIG